MVDKTTKFVTVHEHLPVFGVDNKGTPAEQFSIGVSHMTWKELMKENETLLREDVKTAIVVGHKLALERITVSQLTEFFEDGDYVFTIDPTHMEATLNGMQYDIYNQSHIYAMQVYKRCAPVTPSDIECLELGKLYLTHHNIH